MFQLNLGQCISVYVLCRISYHKLLISVKNNCIWNESSHLAFTKSQWGDLEIEKCEAHARCAGTNCKTVGLKNICHTYKRCGKCCSRLECPKHLPSVDLVSDAGDDRSINDKRDDARKADALKSVAEAQQKLDIAREKASRLHVGF